MMEQKGAGTEPLQDAAGWEAALEVAWLTVG